MAIVKAGAKQKYELQVVVETFLILEKILDAKGGLSLSEICLRTHISKNKAFRMLATLVQCGILEKDERSNYKIGSTSIKNARRILAKPSSLDSAHIMMESLAKTVNEAVYFAKYNDFEAVLVDLVDCSQPIKATSFVGATLPCGTTMPKTGDITVATGGLSAEVTTVSMPYVNEQGVVIGALVVLAPAYRMNHNRVQTEIIPALKGVVQRQHVQLHDILMEKIVSVYPPTGREYAKYPHLVVGTSAKSSKTVGFACSQI